MSDLEKIIELIECDGSGTNDVKLSVNDIYKFAKMLQEKQNVKPQVLTKFLVTYEKEDIEKKLYWIVDAEDVVDAEEKFRKKYDVFFYKLNEIKEFHLGNFLFSKNKNTTQNV